MTSMRKPFVNRRNIGIKELICSHFKLKSLWDYEENKYVVLFEKFHLFSIFKETTVFSM